MIAIIWFCITVICNYTTNWHQFSLTHVWSSHSWQQSFCMSLNVDFEVTWVLLNCQVSLCSPKSQITNKPQKANIEHTAPTIHRLLIRVRKNPTKKPFYPQEYQQRTDPSRNLPVTSKTGLYFFVLPMLSPLTLTSPAEHRCSSFWPAGGAVVWGSQSGFQWAWIVLGDLDSHMGSPKINLPCL